jgi:hypothetical protein
VATGRIAWATPGTTGRDGCATMPGSSVTDQAEPAASGGPQSCKRCLRFQMPNSSSPSGRTFIRLARLGSAVFALLGAALLLCYASDRALLARTARQVDAGRALTPEQRLVAYVDFAHRTIRHPTYRDLPAGLVRLYYRFNPFHPGPGDVLRWGGDYRGSCGSHVRVVVAMLQASGVRCHHLQILDAAGQPTHSVVQARIEGRWVVADALYGIVFRRRDGALASVEDLVADHPNFLAQVQGVRGYDTVHYDFKHVTSFNWKKIPVILPTIHWALERALGPERVAHMVRPRIWMWPQEFYAMACLMASGLLLVAAVWPGRR